MFLGTRISESAGAYYTWDHLYIGSVVIFISVQLVFVHLFLDACHVAVSFHCLSVLDLLI